MRKGSKWTKQQRAKHAATIAQRRRTKTKPFKPKKVRVHQHELRPLIREAARAGLIEAIEHTSNFWTATDGYKKYIDHQIKLQADALMEAVKLAVHQELISVRQQFAQLALHLTRKQPATRRKGTRPKA